MIPEIDTVNIEAVTPEINGGRYPVKRIVGDVMEIEADIFTHGHDIIRAVIAWRKKGKKAWRESEMTLVDNDRWRGEILLDENGAYEYTILAWRDPFLSWAEDTKKKFEAGQDVTSEILEGRKIVAAALRRAKGALMRDADKARFRELLSGFDQVQNADAIRDIILGSELRLLMTKVPDRTDGGRYPLILEVTVDRKQAEFASWYEMWPRSQGTDPTSHGLGTRSATFADMEARLDDIAAMNFDVVYLAPIHPTGHTNRKGPNNSLICPPDSPGCPYAIGNEHGGHTAVDPSLGTLDDFRKFEGACRSRGMEIALDVALQTSPDHPWVKAHPQWFSKRPDGTIKFAENPPKKYEDIYPLDFSTTDREGLWNAVLGIFRFWMKQGVRIFRVDNPHTKPVAFWEWLIQKIHKTDPDVILLAEAFTKPKMMNLLAKSGFTQSYTYFTWRSSRQELIDYFTELTCSDTAEYFRGNLFTNTPDILPKYLQKAPRATFKIRALLASTLGPTWGMYNGFELCEGTPLPGKEEYLDSEKYQFKVWDWNRPGNIKAYLSRLNRIRRDHPALQKTRNLRFYHADNGAVLCYGKHLSEENDHVLIIVNLDPFHERETTVILPIHELGIRHDETYQLHDLLTDKKYDRRGGRLYIKLDPLREPAHIFHLKR